MKHAFLSVTYKRYPLEKAFAAAKEFGYNGVEIYGGRPHAFAFDYDEELRSEILRLKETYEIEVPMVTPELLFYPYNLGSTDPKTAEETLEYLKRTIDLASGIECPRVQTAFGHGGFGIRRKALLNHCSEMIKRLSEYCESRNVTIILEDVTVMESNTVVFLDDILEILEKADSPCVKAMLDISTPVIHWETFTDSFEMLGDKLDYIHFVDCDGAGYHHYPIGEGKLPMKALAKVILAHGYDGWLSTEIVSPYYADPDLYIGREIKRVKELFEKKDNLL